MLTIIGQGRYGTVWRGLIDDQEVAVKVFSAHYRNYFLNEHEVYKEASENQCLLKCYGGGERISPSGSVDYLLVLSLEKECLQEYLKNHTLDLATLCKMSLGIAKGLAHLHSDLGKLCIAHRDINTRNILVRHDLSCCICDLGLAVIPRKTENKSLSEAGTLRYMAPEVLEGAVNLRDCESALKQIDVYALGLVLWELGTRCIDMQAAEPQPYMAPFYKEGGDNPTLEQMQTLVSRRKARPLWPPSWKDTAAARLLCETAEDCWDQDAEARLTSLCVEERLLELPTLRGRVLHPMHPPVSPTPLINNNHLHDHIVDASVGTIETLLSPSEENCKNSNQLAVCVTLIQPYQGRNPCLERNLLTGSTDSLLIDKSSKHCMSSESQNLITNDYLNYQINHRAMPIPYLQNAVHGTFLDTKQINNVNLMPKSKFKWSSIKKLFHGKKEKSHPITCKDTQVKIVPGKLVNSFGQKGVTTSLLTENEVRRPSTLPLTISKPDEVQSTENKSNLAGVSQILKNKNSLLRQRSLEQFAEVFSSTTDLSRLKDPSQRVKTPGDVPPSVRRTRGKAAKESSARFSLYDDRMMTHGQWGSAPDLEPQLEPLKMIG
ncbi:Protein tyrosine and serine/threonine kinase [Popillia japonica]|uniref:Serine/threonine-protein kinase receptor n=1 Tax=Popillia japonica TaxID=7064 RepID=A0AAW1KP96_POPJA